MTADRLLGVSEVAEWLNVPVATLYQWRTRGDGPRGIRVGRYVKFRRSDIDAWIERQADPQRVA